jgi:hypothetical protein
MKNGKKNFNYGGNYYLKLLFIGPLLAFTLGACNNFFHDLVPPSGDRITSFTVPGQTRNAVITDNTITVYVEKGADVHSMLPSVKVSPRAQFIPVTIEYVRAAFPNVDVIKEALNLYQAENLDEYLIELIKQTPGFNIPEINEPIDFAGPVNFIVIAAQGNMREYKVYVVEDTAEPRLLDIRFAKYDNPELIADALCMMDEPGCRLSALAMYPVEMDHLSFALIPSFEILGERLLVDGVQIRSGVDAVAFSPFMFASQTKTFTVIRGGEAKDYTLTIIFSEDPDSIRSIIDFRFNKADNAGIAVNAVASIINTDNTGSIKVQVFYSGAKPVLLTPNFLTPGSVTVNGIPQTSGITSHTFDSPLEYRVVSKNGQYIRIYTVNVELISITADAPRITSFRFSRALNNDLVQDTEGQIGDSAELILIDAYYGSASAPQTIVPEFSAQGIVRVYGSVQVSGASGQDFRSKIKYTVTNPEIPQLTRDYWVETRFTRDTSSDAAITAFGFYPEDNFGLVDELPAKVDQVTGKITVYAPVGSGITTRLMIPRFTAVGQVSVEGTAQVSGQSGRFFNTTVTYTVVSANGKNTRSYVVTVRELRSTIYVNCNAYGYNDGSSWQDAFQSLKDACNAAALFPADVPKEIWIAAGTYKPGNTTADYFPLTANTSYAGGFAGWETSKNQRNTAANVVTISGDLGGVYLQSLFYSPAAEQLNGDLLFENLQLKNASAYGIYTTLSGSGQLSNITAENIKEVNISSTQGEVILKDSNFVNSRVFISSKASASVEVSDCIFNNISTGNALVISRAVNVIIDHVNINGVSNGQGIVFSDNYNVTNMVKISNSTIKNCKTNTRGGGIFITNGKTVEISGTAIENCESSDDGGGIYVSPLGGTNVGTVSISNSTIKNCKSSSHGGGIKILTEKAEVLFTTIENCEANYGEGGMEIRSSLARISNSTIKNCKATNENSFGAGGIYIYVTETAEILGTTVENCEAYSYGGGGIVISGGGSVGNSSAKAIISNSTIKNCKLLSGWGSFGGGISTSCNTTISDTTLELCQSLYASGAVYVSGSNYYNVIINSKFINCTSGDFYKIFDASSFALISGCTFIHDSALPNLPRIMEENSSLFGNKGGNFENCTFTNLKGNMPAGQNYLFNKWTAFPSGGSGTLYGGGANLTMRNCTFNLNSGSAGIMALFGGQSNPAIPPDYLLMDNNTINDNGGQRPLIWLTNSTGSTAGTFQFKAGNVYNGTAVDSATISGLVSNNVMRLDAGAMPILVP